MNTPNPERCRCGGQSKVIDSRAGACYRMRRRECLVCGRRWTTYESLLDPRRVHRHDAQPSPAWGE